MMNIRCLFLPLDGSDLAENALPAGVYFAGLFGASITLFHVIERDAPARIHASRHLTGAEEAETYLTDVCARYIPGNVSVDRHVHTSAARDVARSIVEHAAELQPDLIILCAHGSGGPRDWLIGNIAQQVISRGSTPVLLLHPARPPQPGSAFPCRSILLPMDGVPEHERSGALAEEIARRSGAAVHLAMVVPTPETLSGERAATGRLLPASTAAALDLAEEDAGDYLVQQRERLQRAGLTTSMQVLRGDPATELAGLARGRKDDLIVIGTHGRAGTAAFWSRSVAARVLAKIDTSALLIPVR
jgi:nucleotide-binding universal stress UspA family protein